MAERGTISAVRPGLCLTEIARGPGTRALLWQGRALYAGHGYDLLRADVTKEPWAWSHVGRVATPLWRRVSSRFRPTHRLFRDGLHALALLAGGELVAAVPGAIVRLVPGEDEFRLCHKVVRGTRPLHIAASPNGACYWGEYFDNRERDEVRIYGSKDGGEHWDVVYTFGRGEIRHVHNIKYDRWENCIWILAGDNGAECRVLRASLDFRTIDTVLAGNQQCRAVGLVVRKDGLYFASDTPLETNHIFAMGRDGTVRELAEISSSSIFAGEAAGCMFVSTMVEPSEVNRDQHVRVYGSRDGHEWREVLAWKKDWLPMGLFQYGNAMFPDGENTTDVLALTTVATQERDLELSAWRVQAHS